MVFAILALVTTLTGAIIIFTERGRDGFAHFWRNMVGAALWVASPIVEDLAATLKGVVDAFITAIRANGQPIADAVAAPIHDVARATFAHLRTVLTPAHPVTPADWQNRAADAMADAFGFGIGSFATTAAFEALFPEKLNTLNGVGPMLATMAGFEEVTSSWLRPLLEASVSEPARYDAMNRARPRQLAEQAALNLYSRGLVTHADCRQFLAYAGHPDAHIDALMAGAFRPVSPFVLAASLSDGTIQDADIERAMHYAGFRPEDTTLVLHSFHQRLQQPYRQASLRAVKTAYQRGLIGDGELNDAFNTLSIPNEVQGYVRMEMAYTKLVELSDLYRRGLDESVQYNLTPLADYKAQLQAIGLSQADVDAHYAIVSAKVTGKELQAEARAEARQAAELLRKRTAALFAQYMAGQQADAGVIAALVALGYSAQSAGAIYAAWQARKAGRQRLVYGVLLDPPDAEVLRTRADAIIEAVKKKAVTAPVAVKQLEALKIPANIAAALVELAAITAAKKA